MFLEGQLYIRVLALLVGAWLLIFRGWIKVNNNLGTARLYRLISRFTGCSFNYYYCMFHMSDVWIACWCYSAVTSFQCLLLAPQRIWPVTRVCIYSIPTEQHIRGIKNVSKYTVLSNVLSLKQKDGKKRWRINLSAEKIYWRWHYMTLLVSPEQAMGTEKSGSNIKFSLSMRKRGNLWITEH